MMSKNNNYQDWTKEDLIQEIKRLKKRKKYGLVWLTIIKHLCPVLTKPDLKVIERLQQLGWKRGNTLALPRLEIQFSNGGYQQGNK